MDNYDYNEDHLSTVASNCRYLNYKKEKKPIGNTSSISCSDCRSWNGSGCSRKQFDSIYSEMQLD